MGNKGNVDLGNLCLGKKKKNFQLNVKFIKSVVQTIYIHWVKEFFKRKRGKRGGGEKKGGEEKKAPKFEAN